MSSSPLSPAPSSSTSTTTSPPPAAASPPPSSSAPPPASATPPTTPASSPPTPSTTTSPPPASSPPSSPPAPPPSSPPPPPASAASPAPSASTATPASSSSPPPPPPKNVPSPTSNSSTTAPTTPPPSSVAISSPPPPTSSTLKSPPPPPVSTSSSPTPTTPSSASSSISSGTLVAIAVAGVLALSVVLILAYCLCCRKKKRNNYYLRPSGNHYAAPPAPYKDAYYDFNMKQPRSHSSHSQSSDILLNLPPPPPPPPPPASEHELVPQGVGNGTGSRSWFTYAELATATNGFSKANMLGEGGFGCVYKGVLSNGQVVAVKQLKSGASQGEKQFQAEVEIISRVHHRHLVSLVGYCISESQRLLVYDYVPNNTLEYHLHKRKDGSVMDWSTRMKVASGAARGLAYLHEDCHPRIIHRDIKSANILLDNNFEAQVADFGLAKLTSDLNTHVTTRVMGTFGYLAPEYASSGKLTEKSDVFSFGVVLLELATGRKPVDPSQPPGEESLVEWARPILAQVEREEDLKLVADPLLKGLYDSGEMMRMVEAAAACVRYSANKRPRMGQVVRALEDDSSLSDLSKGLKPGYSRGCGSSFSSNDYENGSYSTDMRKFRQMLNESGVSINQSVSSSSGFQTSMEMEHRSSERPVPGQRNMQSGSSNEFSAGSRSNG